MAERKARGTSNIVDRQVIVENPYRPGAGHVPPVLGGRENELDFFRRSLRQKFITENVLVTGLRGFGKTVLVEHLKLIALDQYWVWAGADLSESSSLTEERLALRILTDVASALGRSVAEGGIKAQTLTDVIEIADSEATSEVAIFEGLSNVYRRKPGLPSDKLQAALTIALSVIAQSKLSGLVLMYDEAQCMSDHAESNEFPLSMFIETIATLQKSDATAPCMLVLSGLPGVHDALTATRTYTERMFRVLKLERLSRSDTDAALTGPLERLSPPLQPSRVLIDKAIDLSGGYPYLIQFFGKELVDQLVREGGSLQEDKFPSEDALARLDAGLFGARWNKTTEAQRDFLKVLATRPMEEGSDFSANDIAGISLYTNSQASSMLHALSDRGLVYRSRHGRYAFTVPMSEAMILGRLQSEEELERSWIDDIASELEAAKEERPRKRWRWFR